ncbi:jhy protein homolog [Xenopus laevis]|uniref:Jhy protein homolog n=2 Tax=Xenopus laevis TaxID=8355 RepID=A0A1L8FG19_XENLA|nr:jhy protein homolog [Xenopus laevis]OCT70507.1 hypothetical protein XELAEV_18037428mg [Xenopus laevis]
MGERTTQPLEELDLNLSLDSLDESDTESLTQEIQYQSQLQDRIFNIEELVKDVQPDKRQNYGKQKDFNSDRARKDAIVDENDKIANTPNHKNGGTGHKEISFQKEDSSYCDLRYDPNWKKHQSHKHSMAAYTDQEEFSDVSSSFSDDLSVHNRLMHQKKADDETVLVISGKTENKLPCRMANKHRNNVPNDLSNRKSESCEELRVTKVNKHRFKSAESNTVKSNKDFIETNKLTLGTHTTHTKQSYLNMYTKKKEDAPDMVKENKEINSVKNITEPRSRVANLVKPSRKPKHTRQEHHLSAHKFKQTVLANEMPKDTYIPSHIIKDRQFINITSSTSMPDLLLNMDLSKQKYTTTKQVTPKESPSGFFPAAKDNYYDKHFLSSGQVLNGYIATDNLHLNQWQDTKCDDILLNQNHIEMGYAPFNGVKVYEYLTTISQMENDNFINEEDRNQNTHSNPESDGCQTVLKKNHETQRKIPKGYVNQEIKLGGIGPSYIISKQKKEQLHSQKEYAKAIQECNRNKTATVRKAPELQTEQNDRNKGAWHKGLEYAKNIPKPQPFPKPTEQKKEERSTQPVVHDQFSSQIKLLEALQMRHEQEKVAVAALSALHIL